MKNANPNYHVDSCHCSCGCQMVFDLLRGRDHLHICPQCLVNCHGAKRYERTGCNVQMMNGHAVWIPKDEREERMLRDAKLSAERIAANRTPPAPRPFHAPKPHVHMKVTNVKAILRRLNGA